LLGTGESVETPMVSQMEDFTSSRAFRVTGLTASAEAGITHCDVDHLMIYDVRCSQLGEASRICRSAASRIWALCRAPRPAPSSPSATLPPAHQIVIPGQVTHAYLLALAVATKGQSASLIGAYRQRPSAAAGARSTSSAAAGEDRSLSFRQSPRFSALRNFHCNSVVTTA